MAGTSQRVEEWGRYGVPPRRDVGAALAALLEEDLLRLRAIARLRARSRSALMKWASPGWCRCSRPRRPTRCCQSSIGGRRL